MLLAPRGRARGTALLAVLLACPGPGKPPPKQCAAAEPVGDAQKPIELLPFGFDEVGQRVLLINRSPLYLAIPGQGGYVLYAGVAARNLDGCNPRLQAQLVDKVSGKALTGFDERSLHLVAAEDGFWYPAKAALASRGEVANIPACPDALHQGVAGRIATLHLEVEDTNGKKASLDLEVVPTCLREDQRCACLCGPDPGGC